MKTSAIARSLATLLALSLAASADAQFTRRVSVDADGDQVAWGGRHAVVSADNTTVAFTSFASDLVPGDTNGVSDVFVKDLLTQEVTRVSVDSNGVQADDNAYLPAISADGMIIVFNSFATNLVPDDTNGAQDCFVHDRRTGETVRASVRSSGAQFQHGCFGRSLSADGRSFAFNARTKADWSESRTIVRDLWNQTNRRVDVDDQGNHSSGGVDFATAPALSADGSAVAFAYWEDDLVAADTNGWADVFLRDLNTQTTEWISQGDQGAATDGPSGQSLELSADGQMALFVSWATNVVPGDTNGEADHFLHDRATGDAVRVNLDLDGQEIPGLTYGAVSLSAEGTQVAFLTPVDLDPRDTNLLVDAYVRDLANATTRWVSAGLGDSAADDETWDCRVAPDGSGVVMVSNAGNLVGDDTNGGEDVFLHGPEVRLQSNASTYAAGDALEFVSFGGIPGERTLLFVTSLDGSPFFAPTGLGGNYDPAGTWTFSGLVPDNPALSGLQLGLRAFTRGSGGKVVSTLELRIGFEE